MILKPGKYVQRDGGIATVAAVDETRRECRQAVGWDSYDETTSWGMDGRWLPNTEENGRDLISEYIEPPVAREGWGVIFNSKELADHYAERWGESSFRVREILP